MLQWYGYYQERRENRINVYQSEVFQDKGGRPSLNFGKTKTAYPWSWHMKAVPYYCVHCCHWAELVPMKSTGIPVRITEYDPDPDAPCRFYFYKKPELIAEKYYRRIGLEKPRK